MRKQIATYIKPEAWQAIKLYCEQHPGTTSYKVAQEAIEKGAKELDSGNKNQNGQSTGNLSGNPANTQRGKSPSGTTDNGELEE